MRAANHHEPFIVRDLVDPVGQALAIGFAGKVIHIHAPHPAPPGSPSIPKIADQFLFLRIHADNRAFLLLKTPAAALDVPKLLVASRRLFAFTALGIDP